MKIIIQVKNLAPTKDLQDFIEKKISSLKKFIDVLKNDVPKKGKTLAEVFVEVEKETQHHKKGDIFISKIRVRLPGKSIMAGAETEDLFRAIIKSKNELKKEIEKYKVKNIYKNRRQQRKLKQHIIK